MVLFAATASMSISYARCNSLHIGTFTGLRHCAILGKRPQALAMRRQTAHPSLQTSCASTETLDKIQEIIANQLFVDLESVKPETKFTDLGANSLDTVEIVMTLEEKFGVDMDEAASEGITTVQQVADLIENQKVAA